MFINADAFLQAYEDVNRGTHIYPRGTVCKEAADYRFTLDMRFSPLTSFRARNLSLNYAKQELLWYLRADKFDHSIEKHASTWAKIRQPDGSYYSNYGQYIFPKQFAFVVEELLRDDWSRRASIVLLKPEHLYSTNPDVVCTYAMNFSIRDGLLNMRVHMRSNDIIFGMTNDVFCFSMIYRMVYSILRSQKTGLGVGQYVHMVDSLHVYDRHFSMIKQIIQEGRDGYAYNNPPWPTPEEATLSSLGKGLGGNGQWSNWLRSTP